MAPPVRSEKLREWTGVVRATVDDVRNSWKDIPAEQREWLRLWAIDELPKPSPVGRLMVRLMSGVLYAAHPTDVSNFLTEGQILREAVLEQVATAVWQTTLDDADFARAYLVGTAEIAEGKGVRVTPDGM